MIGPLFSADIAATSHPLIALVSEFSDTVGDPHGGWVHWGATTQNITQTGDALMLCEVHEILLRLLGDLLAATGSLADRAAEMVEPRRTHGQQAVPITFGLKVAAWIDELSRHVERLREIEKRVFTAMAGDAVGSFASLGAASTAVQAGVAKRLGSEPLRVPSGAVSDSLAEYVCILGLLAGSVAKIAGEIHGLMKTEVGEVREPVQPAGGHAARPRGRRCARGDDRRCGATLLRPDRRSADQAQAAQVNVADGVPFSEALTADPRINAHLDATAIAELLEPCTQIGLSAQLAGDAAERARQLAAELGCVPPTRAAQ